MITKPKNFKTTETQFSMIEKVAKKYNVNLSKAMRAILYLGEQKIQDDDETRELFNNIDAILTAQELDKKFHGKWRGNS